MANRYPDPVIIERAMEQLRQERETFDQRKGHEERWFTLRLLMGYSAVFLLAAILALCSYILLNNTSFSTAVVTTSGSALFVDVLGLLVGVWKISLNPNFLTKLEPVTQSGPPFSGSNRPPPQTSKKDR